MNTYPLKFYVYAYLRKSDLTPYYIGKGTGSRAWAKQHNVKIPTDANRIVIVESNLTNIGALAIERQLIRWYGRKDLETGILRNLTDGGDGTFNLVPSEKRKLACIKSNRERVWTEESKNKLRKFNSGKKQTSESNVKRSQTLKGRVFTEEHKLRISQGQKGRVQSAETKAIISAKKRARDAARKLLNHKG
jgi:hypothetical protein